MPWIPPAQPTPFNVKPEDVLFIDTETVPKVLEYIQLDEAGKKVFNRKFINDEKEKSNALLWKEKAALHCEFNKIASSCEVVLWL